jgi:hypothetical protein
LEHDSRERAEVFVAFEINATQSPAIDDHKDRSTMAVRGCPARRELRTSLCRSSSVRPPQTPSSWSPPIAHIKHFTRTGHPAQTALALMI